MLLGQGWLMETVSHSSLAPGSCCLLCPRYREMGVPGPGTPASYRDGEFLALRLEPHSRHPKLECSKKIHFKDSVTQGLIFLQCTQVPQVPPEYLACFRNPQIPHSLISIGKLYTSSKKATWKHLEHSFYQTGTLILREQHRHFLAWKPGIRT